MIIDKQDGTLETRKRHIRYGDGDKMK